MITRVTVLEKSEGSWSNEEVETLISAGVEVSGLITMPQRLVASNNPLSKQTFQEILGHLNFTERQVPYPDRWNP